MNTLPKFQRRLKQDAAITVGRTDARAPEGLEGSNRARQRYRLGADVIFVEAPDQLKSSKKVANEA